MSNKKPLYRDIRAASAYLNQVVLDQSCQIDIDDEFQTHDDLVAIAPILEITDNIPPWVLDVIIRAGGELKFEMGNNR